MTIRMAYEMVMPYHLHMPSYFLETFTEYPSEDKWNIESLKDAGNDLDMEVLLRVTLLCIVSNNSYTKVGNIGDITKYFLVYFLYRSDY